MNTHSCWFSKEIVEQWQVHQPGFHHSNQWPISSKYNPFPVSAAARLTSIQILLTQFYLSSRGQETKAGLVDGSEGGENTAFHQRGREAGKHAPLQTAGSKCFMLCVFPCHCRNKDDPPPLWEIHCEEYHDAFTTALFVGTAYVARFIMHDAWREQRFAEPYGTPVRLHASEGTAGIFPPWKSDY